jgi:hypothetical protein
MERNYHRRCTARCAAATSHEDVVVPYRSSFHADPALIGKSEALPQRSNCAGNSAQPPFLCAVNPRRTTRRLASLGAACALVVTLAACGPSGDGSGGSPTALFGAPVLTELGATPGSLVFSDFNGDGRLDVALRLVGASAAVLLGNGDGTFQPGRIIGGLADVEYMTVGDLNGDGKPDLAVTGCVTQSCPLSDRSLFVLLGKGDGTFQPPVAYPAIAAASALCVGDFNVDGRADVAVVRDSGTVSLLRGNGDGSLQGATDWTIGFTGGATSLVCVDFNADGKRDLAGFTIGGFFGYISVLPGYGNATFDAPLITMPNVSPAQQAIVDFNRDGRPDVAFNGGRFRGPGQLTIMLGKGDGTFGAAANPEYPIAYWTATFAAGDIDRDGNPDLVVRSSDTSSLSILYGKGDGTFLPAQEFPLGLDGASVDRLVDLSGDGRLDLVLTTPTGLAVLPGTR